MAGSFCYLATGKYEVAISDTIMPVIDVKPWIVGEMGTPAGVVPRVATHLNAADRMGAVRMRIGLRRMGYPVEPGLYAVGTPTADSPVFVSANYKLSFDYLRREYNHIRPHSSLGYRPPAPEAKLSLTLT